MVRKRRVVFPYNTTFNKIPIFRPHSATLYKNVQGTPTSVTGRMLYHTDILRVCTHLYIYKAGSRQLEFWEK